MKSELNLQSEILAVEDVHIRELPDSAIALNLNNENYYGLNQVAYQIYQALVNSKNVSEALDNLNQIFDVEPEMLKNDTFDLIQELEKDGIVKIINE